MSESGLDGLMDYTYFEYGEIRNPCHLSNQLKSVIQTNEKCQNQDLQDERIKQDIRIKDE